MGGSGVSKTSYFWMVFVPIAAKFLEYIKNPIEIDFGLNYVFHVNIALPFSWSLLFFASLFISMGNILYSIRCPDIIAPFSDYNDYKNSGRGYVELFRRYNYAILERESEHARAGMVSFLLRTFLNREEDDVLNWAPFGRQSLNNMIASIRAIPDNRIGDLFWFVRSHDEYRRTWSRFFVSIFYAIGLMLVVAIVIENIFFVSRSFNFMTFWNNLHF